MKKIFFVWGIYINHSLQQTFVSRSAAGVMLVGKSLRLIVFIAFLYFLLSGSQSLVGYNRTQVIFFYLTFNLIDTLAQLLFREVYRFRQLVIEGNLDFVLVKPINPLIKILLGGFDALDALMLIPLILGLTYFGLELGQINFINLLIYVLLLLNGLLIATAFHIFVLGLGILTTSVDHMIFIYRDLTGLLRFPVDIYREPIRAILTFIIPLGIMLTFPSKALMGLLNPALIVVSFGIGGVFLFASLWFWKFSLKYYQSASS